MIMSSAGVHLQKFVPRRLNSTQDPGRYRAGQVLDSLFDLPRAQGIIM